MTDRTKLIEINYITDHDTDMYRVGETDFAYNGSQLEEYVARYGADDLKRTLCFFIAEVVRLERESNTRSEQASANSA